MQKKIFATLTLNLGVIVCGCSLLAPDRADPSINLPASFGNSKQLIESNLPYMAWWQKFEDPNLNQFIESGLINNTSIAQAQANIEQAQGQLKSVQLSWIPSIAAFAGIFNMYPMLPQPQMLYGAFAGYNSINIFTQIAQQKAAHLNLEVQKQAFEGAKLDLIANIAISYYTLSSQQAELKLYQLYVADLAKKLKIYQNYKSGGLANTSGEVNLEQSLKQARAQLKTIENNIICSQNALNYLLNRNPGTPLITNDFNTTKMAYANLSATPATVIGNRPDVKVSALQFKYAAQNITATYAQLLPSFQLNYGPSQLVSGGLPGMPSGAYSAFQSEFINWSLNPSVFGQVDMYRGKEKYSYVNYIDTVRKALRDVSNDLATNNITYERYNLILGAAADANKKYSYTYNMYQTGLKSFTDTLSDKLTLDEALISVNQIKLSQMQAIINLYKDLGGGYKYHESSL